MTVSGIDVASYQPTAYDTAGLSFVFVKATEGTGYANPNHTGQVATARAHGLVTGHYHFVRPGDTAAQVAYFLANASPKPGDILALDWEDTGVSNAAKDAWIKACQKAAPGNRVLLYCNLDFWLNRDRTSQCGDGLWIADPGAVAGHPQVEHPWTLHQYSEAGGIDRNAGQFATNATFRTWANKGAVPAPPPAHRYEPFPGAAWFTTGRKSAVVAAMHQRLVAVGCSRYRSHTNLNILGSGDEASYEAWQRKYNADHHKHWSGAALKWPPGKETWDALQVPNV